MSCLSSSTGDRLLLLLLLLLLLQECCGNAANSILGKPSTHRRAPGGDQDGGRSEKHVFGGTFERT